MACVKVKFFATLKEKAKMESIEVEASTFYDAVKNIILKLPDLKTLILDENLALRKDFIYLVNGRNIEFLDKENTVLKDGDIITIFPPIAGG